MIGASAAYENLSKLTYQYLTILFRLTTHFKTLFRYISKYSSVIFFNDSVQLFLKRQTFTIYNTSSSNKKTTNQILILIFDNSQKNFIKGKQIGGGASTFLKLPSTFFLEYGFLDLLHPSHQKMN